MENLIQKNNKSKKDQSKVSKVLPLHYKLTQNEQPSLNCFICSPPGQGKSYLMFNILLQNMIQKNNKQCHIFVFSYTLQSSINDKYSQLLSQYKNSYLFNELPQQSILEFCIEQIQQREGQQNNIDQLMKQKIIYKKNNEINYNYDDKTLQNKIIIILDDIELGEKQLKQLFRLKRHYNASVFCISQSIIDMSKSLRQMCDVFCIRKVNENNLIQYYDQQIQALIDKDKFLKLYHDINEQKYQFLCIQPFNQNNFISQNFQNIKI